jgi:hypothetical protein
MGDDELHGGPIFIGGVERSGKTYMRLMLSAHPDIVVSRRTNMWPDFYNKYGDLGRLLNLERCLEAMLRHKHIRSLGPDADRIRRDFWQGFPTYGRLFALIHEQYTETVGKRRWGDQTELIEQFAGPILTAYPDAKIIHLIRDPRDRHEAALSEKSRRRNGVGYTTARWLYSANLACRNQRNYPSGYKVVRYESMVLRPEETMAEVCQFLGESYTPAMISMESAPRFKNKRHPDSEPGSSPLSAEFIGRFHSGLSGSEVAFIQKYAGRQMSDYGYRPVVDCFSPLKKLRHIRYWSVNMARMAGWYALKSIRTT